MKTEQEWNASILEITLKIQQHYPELSKYINEMPVSTPDVKHPEINIKNLQDYYESLKGILDQYGAQHPKDV